MTFDDLIRTLAAAADVLAEVAARFTYGVLAAALVFAVAQWRGGTPAAEVVNTAGWVALATVTAWLAFTAARLLLADPDSSTREVPA